MSNISRRNFIKGAGVAALAVAAAGVLAGCSGNGEELTKEVVISYFFVDEQKEIGTQKLTVGIKDTTVPVTKLQIPTDYKLVADAETVKEYPIDKDGNVKVEVTGTKSKITEYVLSFTGDGESLDPLRGRVEGETDTIPAEDVKNQLKFTYPDYRLADESATEFKGTKMGEYLYISVKVIKK